MHEVLPTVTAPMRPQAAAEERTRVQSAGDGRRRPAVRIVAFFAVLIAVLFGTDALVNTGLRTIDTSAFGVFNRIARGGIDADIVVSGSSRALNHFDPRIIERRTGRTAMNIGMNGSQTDMQVAVFRTVPRSTIARPACWSRTLILSRS